MQDSQLDYSKFDSTEKIVQDLLQNEDFLSNLKVFLAEDDLRNRGWFGSLFTREIRKRYSLWHESPLTKNWRDKPESRNIVSGVDYSKDHPDNISSKIFYMCLERIDNARTNGTSSTGTPKGNP
jgi:hypothetical protein